MDYSARIFIAGHKGMVGSALVRRLEKGGYGNLILKTRAEMDLTDQKAVTLFYEQEKPEIVIDAAAKVGGILANNTYRADFLHQNLVIQTNLIHGAHIAGVKKLIFLGSSCIYPRSSPQPMKEEYLLTGLLEETNEPYAIAKISGIKMCENYFLQYEDNFISLMPTNLYGFNDNFDLKTSHVLPALIRKFVDAKADGSSVTIWGTGSPRREFLFVDDVADAIVFALDSVEAERLYAQGISHLNVGTGADISISDLAKTIQSIVGHEGELKFDSSIPDGTPQKLLDVSRLHAMGWRHQIVLEEGIRRTYEWFLKGENLRI